MADIGWRSTRIRMLPNNLVLVPQRETVAGDRDKLLPSPDRELAVLVEVGVAYDSDLTHVEQLTCDVAKETLQHVTGGVPGFDPFIRYHTFGDSSIDFTLILRAREYVDQYLVKHEFIKRLHDRYRRDGITIPSPIQTIVPRAPFW